MKLKKKNNIIKCYNWFEKLITQGVSTAKKISPRYAKKYK